MNTFEHKDYFDGRWCFKGDEEKVVVILDSYFDNTIDLSDINRVMELYHTKLFFDSVHEIPSWSKEKYEKYKSLSDKAQEEIHKFFSGITAENAIEITKQCYVTYWDDYRCFFYKFQIYKCIPKDLIITYLKEFRWNTQHILEDKKFVEYFDEELSLLLQDETYGYQFIISHYLEQHDNKYKVYIPKSLSVENRINMIYGYLESDHVNPNILSLIIDAKNTRELPITPKMKKRANERIKDFWNRSENVTTFQHGISVSFGPKCKESYLNYENDTLISEFNTKWIMENTDYPTLLNNFIYYFEFVNKHMLCSLASNQYNLSGFEEIFSTKANGAYAKGHVFDMMDTWSDLVTRGYVEELRKIDIHIEDIIKWFFETYLPEEFDIIGFRCNVPLHTDSLLSKCKTIASAFDGILTQYKMFCEDGEVDNELL